MPLDHVMRGIRFELPDADTVRVMSAMTGNQRLAVTFQLIEFTRGLVESSVRDAHPDWPDEQVRSAVVERVMRGAT